MNGRPRSSGLATTGRACLHPQGPCETRLESIGRVHSQRGYSLLEVLVATVIMGTTVAALLLALSVSLRNTRKVVDNDRAVILARSKMDELLLDRRLPNAGAVQGRFDEAEWGDVTAGWRATVSAFEVPPDPQPTTEILERIELEIWWGEGASRQSFRLEGFRRGGMQGAMH